MTVAGTSEINKNFQKYWNSKLVDAFIQRFANQDNLYFEQWRSDEDFGYCKKQGNIKHAIIQHLLNKKTISMPAISAEGLSKWCCWDSDTIDGLLEKVSATLNKLEFNPVREGKREGRDGHLWLFFDKPISASKLLKFKSIIACTSGIDEKSLEFFPKTDRGHSQSRLPLGTHRKPGANNAVGWFEGIEHDIESQLAWISSQPYDSAEGVLNIVEYMEQKEKPIKKKISIFQKSNMCGDEQIDWRQIFPEHRRIGKDLAGPCPICQSLSLDNTGDNLRMSLDGRRINCVTNGINNMHNTGDIYNWYRSQFSD